MRIVFFIILLLQSCLFAAQTDFDVAVVGTSPVSMLEAISHIHQNKRVLILEADERCGGAWKSIDICGIAHADLGCHTIGADPKIKEFLEKYFDCTFVCMEHPRERAGAKHAGCRIGFYFSGGCHELISKLERAIVSRENALLLHQRLESIYIDSEKQCVELFLGDVSYTTAKLIVTPASTFSVQNSGFNNWEAPKHSTHHLYLLIEDPTPFRFTYQNGIAQGMTRAMNLTPFLEMPKEGLQLIVIQTSTGQDLVRAEEFLNRFKQKGLLDASAAIIASEPYVYNQGRLNTTSLLQYGGKLIEALDSSSYASMSCRLEKWKSAMLLNDSLLKE